jgi:GNAT superfamily N-acetyltransferase
VITIKIISCQEGPANQFIFEGKSMEISQAAPAELPEIMALIASCVRDMEARQIHQWDEIYPDESVIRKDVDSRTLYAARRNGRITGIIVLNESPEPQYGEVPWRYPGKKILVVHRLLVDPRRQRRGIAGRLMDFAEGLAEDQGYQTIRLDAFVENPGALTFYERRGYHRAGRVIFRKGPFDCFEKEIKKGPGINYIIRIK